MLNYCSFDIFAQGRVALTRSQRDATLSQRNGHSYALADFYGGQNLSKPKSQKRAKKKANVDSVVDPGIQALQQVLKNLVPTQEERQTLADKIGVTRRMINKMISDGTGRMDTWSKALRVAFRLENIPVEGIVQQFMDLAVSLQAMPPPPELSKVDREWNEMSHALAGELGDSTKAKIIAMYRTYSDFSE